MFVPGQSVCQEVRKIIITEPLQKHSLFQWPLPQFCISQVVDRSYSKPNRLLLIYHSSIFFVSNVWSQTLHIRFALAWWFFNMCIETIFCLECLITNIHFKINSQKKVPVGKLRWMLALDHTCTSFIRKSVQKVKSPGSLLRLHLSYWEGEILHYISTTILYADLNTYQVNQSKTVGHKYCWYYHLICL